MFSMCLELQHCTKVESYFCIFGTSNCYLLLFLVIEFHTTLLYVYRLSKVDLCVKWFKKYLNSWRQGTEDFKKKIILNKAKSKPNSLSTFDKKRKDFELHLS